MTRPGAIAGSCLLSVLVISVLASPASATVFPAGTSAFTCKLKAPSGGVGFSKAHCKAADAVGTNATYEHVLIPEGTSTSIEATSKDTAGVNQNTTMEGTLGGATVKIQATEATATGSLKTSESTTAEHVIRGEGVVTYNHVTVLPSTLGCIVKGEKIVTNTLTATTAGQGAAVKIQPLAPAGVIATFETEACTVSEYNGVHVISGYITCPVDGATIGCTQAATKAQATLKVDGAPFGIEGTSKVATKVAAVSVTAPTAPTNSTTGFTCRASSVHGAGFTESHCKATTTTGAAYEHVAIAESTTGVPNKTNFELTNSDTAGSNHTAKLKTVIAGILVELQAAKVSGTGNMTNGKSEIGEHFSHGEVSIAYKEATVTLPAGKGCKVEGGEFKTAALRWGDVGMSDKLEPETGERFATVVIEGCSIGTLNHSWELLGTVACAVSGATTTCTHVETTEHGDLRITGGSKVGIDSVLAASSKAETGDVAYTPLSVGTVTTP